MARGSKAEHRFPERGTPGGWRDVWDSDDTAEVRARAEEADRRLTEQARQLGRHWRDDERGERDGRASGATAA